MNRKPCIIISLGQFEAIEAHFWKAHFEALPGLFEALLFPYRPAFDEAGGSELFLGPSPITLSLIFVMVIVLCRAAAQKETLRKRIFGIGEV